MQSTPQGSHVRRSDGAVGRHPDRYPTDVSSSISICLVIISQGRRKQLQQPGPEPRRFPSVSGLRLSPPAGPSSTPLLRILRSVEISYSSPLDPIGSLHLVCFLQDQIRDRVQAEVVHQ